MSGTQRSTSTAVLIEGELEKRKVREFPWNLAAKSPSTTWVLRYYVLRLSCNSVPNDFLLEQHEDSTPFSKVQKKLKASRIVQVDTNISFCVGSQNWIFAIYYLRKRGQENKVLYLAAQSELEMNQWIEKLCEACNLQKREVTLIPNSSLQLDLDDWKSTNEQKKKIGRGILKPLSFVTPKIDLCNELIVQEDIFSSKSDAYVRLKDCSSSRSVGSCSSKCSSPVNSPSASADHQQSTFEVSSCSSSFLSRSAKPSPALKLRKVNSSDNDILFIDQEFKPFNLSEIDCYAREKWKDELDNLDRCERRDSYIVRLPSEPLQSFRNHVPNTPRPLPRQSKDYQNLPPEIDRTCKPSCKYSQRRDTSVDGTRDNANFSNWSWQNQYNVTLPSRKCSEFSAYSLNFFSPEINVLSSSLQSKDIYGSGPFSGVSGVLEYIDPVQTPSLIKNSPHSVRVVEDTKRFGPTEYALIDEEKTTAVWEANRRQNQLRREGSS